MADSLRHNGRVWVAQIDLGRRYDGRQIKRKRRLHHSDTIDGERAARRKMDAWIGAIGTEDMTRTVSAILDEWVRLTRAGWSDAHLDNVLRASRTKVKPRIGTADIGGLTRHDVEDLYADLRRSGAANGGPLGERSVGLVHATLSAAEMAPDPERGIWLRFADHQRLAEHYRDATFAVLDRPFWLAPPRDRPLR